jgi:site-specific DNA-methyltransferase (adenine-specific)
MLSLHHGDCLEVMKEIPDKSVHLIICDLPYGCLTAPRASVGPGWRKEVEAGKKKTLYREEKAVCAWDIPIDLAAFWEQVRRIRKDDHTPTIHFCTTKFGYDLIRSNEKEFRYDLVWSKSNAVGFLSANKKPMSAHEMIYVFSKAGANYNRIDLSGNFPAGGGGRSTANFLPIAGMPNTSTTVAGRRCVKSVIEIANKKSKGGHPTQKPVELYKWLIERYSKEGDTVLDPTFGSGNSVFTAVELRRNAIGIEKDKAFFDKANAAISDG